MLFNVFTGPEKLLSLTILSHQYIALFTLQNNIQHFWVQNWPSPNLPDKTNRNVRKNTAAQSITISPLCFLPSKQCLTLASQRGHEEAMRATEAVSYMTSNSTCSRWLFACRYTHVMHVWVYCAHMCVPCTEVCAMNL